MARSVQITDSRRPDYGPTIYDDGVVADGRSRIRSSGSLLILLVVLLVIAGFLMNRNSGSFSFQGNRSLGSIWTPFSSESTPVQVTMDTRPGSAELPVIGADPSAGTVGTVNEASVVWPQANAQTDVIGYARVAADTLYMRSGPGAWYQAIYALPRDWPVSLLKQSHLNNYGEVWVEVMVESNQGFQKGWVSRQYLRY